MQTQNTINQQQPPPPVASFQLGHVVATHGALEALYEAGQEALEFLRRHSRLEQGVLNDRDHQLNHQALIDGSRIFSAFKTSLDEKLWIITEAVNDEGERASTCILLPSEY